MDHMQVLLYHMWKQLNLPMPFGTFKPMKLRDLEV
jgi:hypothetical protein